MEDKLGLVINVQYVNMDTAISEQIVSNKDGSYTVLLNARLTHENNISGYKHALKHIIGDDFSKYSADDIERFAHDMEVASESGIFTLKH